MLLSDEADCKTMSPALLWNVGDVVEHSVNNVYSTFRTGKKTRESTILCSASLYP
jgi:hypothetical protein